MWKHTGLEPVLYELHRELTWGSKTFQYPEENKLKSIAQVAASENAEAQTRLRSLFKHKNYRRAKPPSGGLARSRSA